MISYAAYMSKKKNERKGNENILTQLNLSNEERMRKLLKHK